VTARLHRILGPLDGLAIVVGFVIGAGILGTPGLIAGYLGDPRLILGVWLFGGVSTALTALVLAELGAMIPAAGGKYAFVREAYGDTAGCFAGWGELLLTRSFGGAAKAVLIGQYVVMLAGGRGSPRLVAAAATVAFLLLHLRGIRAGRAFQNASTVLKVGLLAVIVGAGFLRGDGASWSSAAAAAPPAQGLFLGVALAFQLVFFSYYGAEASLQVSEELRDPGRSVPLMLLAGVAAVTLLYLLLNVAFLNTLTPAAMAGSPLVAQDVLAKVVGERTGLAVAVVALGIVVSSFNYNFFGAPRIAYGLARDGLAPRTFTRVNAAGTPTAALYLTSTVIFVVAASGAFELVLRFMSFLALVVDGLVLTTVFVLRRDSTRPRPFRVPWYPLVPATAVALYSALIVLIGITQPRLAFGGTTLLAAVAVGAWIATRHRAATARV
jgi:APA family basic amino acid/polyamine antiporter